MPVTENADWLILQTEPVGTLTRGELLAARSADNAPRKTRPKIGAHTAARDYDGRGPVE